MCGTINPEILELIFLYFSLLLSKMSAVLVNQEVLFGILGSVPLEPGWREHHDCCLLAETLKSFLEKAQCGKRPPRFVARRCHCSSGVTISSLETRFCGVRGSSEHWCHGAQQGLALYCSTETVQIIN